MHVLLNIYPVKIFLHQLSFSVDFLWVNFYWLLDQAFSLGLL